MTMEAWIGIAGFIVLLILIFMRVWVGLAMIIIGFAGIWVLKSFGVAESLLGNDAFTQATSYAMTCMPMFTIMGTIISHTGLGAKLYRWAKALVGHIAGGLGMATVCACALFAAICGNSQITALTLGRIAFPEMKKAGYSDSISAGGIAAGGGIGVMIPPSLGFMIYGIITEQSIGRLFMCGLIPGLVLTLLYCTVYFITGKRHPELVPVSERASRKELLDATKDVWPIMLVMIIMLGGIYGGFFTATEAGAIGAVCSILIAKFTTKGAMTKKVFYGAMLDGTRTCGMVMILLIGAKVFLRFITLSGLATIACDAILGLNVSKYAIIAMVFLLYLLLGSMFDIMSAILLTVPFLFPVLTQLGFDPLWFGVFVVGMMEMGDITPPVGLSTFIVAEAFNLPTKTVFKGIAPFIVCQFIFMALITIFPQICLLLVK